MSIIDDISKLNLDELLTKFDKQPLQTGFVYTNIFIDLMNILVYLLKLKHKQKPNPLITKFIIIESPQTIKFNITQVNKINEILSIIISKEPFQIFLKSNKYKTDMNTAKQKLIKMIKLFNDHKRTVT